jgi:hypothetical protein
LRGFAGEELVDEEGIQNPEYRIQNTEYRIQNTEYRMGIQSG